MSSQDTIDTVASTPSPMESALGIVNLRISERAALARAFERLESQLDRIEGQVHKIESHFHQLAIRLVGNHGELLKLLLQQLEKLDHLDTNLGAGASAGTARPLQRPRRAASKRRKAA